MLTLGAPAMSRGTDNAITPFSLSPTTAPLTTLGFTATLRQLKQEIQLVLTPQGFRIENSDGGITDQADRNDI